MLAHDGFEITEISEIPRVLSGPAMQNCECSRGIVVLSVSDGSVWRRFVVLNGYIRHKDGQLPDFGFARQVFYGG